MRIVAGQFRGRRLALPSDRRVRVTTERVREAWLSILTPFLDGSHVLDLFAGSGVLGLEALSRGAVSADFVDLSRASVRAIRANAAALQVEESVRVHHGDALRFVARPDINSYDIAFADPPFSTDQAVRLTDEFKTRPFASILTIEHRSSLDLPGGETRRYGDIALTLFHSP
ncbi:MAG: RsmD family RNA methyltransferase [Gemmatimonadales bacterium]